MEKDKIFHSFDKSKSLVSKAEKQSVEAVDSKHRESLSLSSSSSVTEAISSCQFDVENAVAESSRTKAVIAGLRHDFFSDLLLPLASARHSYSNISNVSRPQACSSISGNSFSSTISKSQSSISALGVDSRNRFGDIVVSTSASNWTSSGSNVCSQRVECLSVAVDSTLESMRSFHPVSTECLSFPVTTGYATAYSCAAASLTNLDSRSNIEHRKEKVSHQVGNGSRYLGADSNESDQLLLSNEMNQVDKIKICQMPDCSLSPVSRAKDAQFSHAANLPLEHSDASTLLQSTRDDMTATYAPHALSRKEEHNSDNKDLASRFVVPSVELVPAAPVCLTEPACIEMTSQCMSGSICLEPSPERIWGPRVAFLTFSCLDVSEAQVLGHIRQVNSTGCLDELGSSKQQHLDSDQHTKLLASDGDFSHSTQFVSDSEKSEKSLNEEHLLISGIVSKSFLECDMERIARDGSFRGSKKSNAGWSLGWHSPSTRRKRGDPATVTKPKESWKGRVVRTLRRYGSATVLSTSEHISQRTKGTFDVPIELCARSSENRNLPLFVEFCSRIIEEKGLENRGIYRVPGNSGFMKQMVEDLNEDPVGLCAENEKWNDVNTVSSLLKLFFRKLPEPLITDELYQPVIAASRLTDPSARLLKLREILRSLPPINYETFHYLAQHLRRIAEHEAVNKMDAHNLAIIFGPSLIRPCDNSIVSMVTDMNDLCRVIESIILHSDWFFGDLEEEVEMLISEDSKGSTPVSSMSEELLAKAHQCDIRGSVCSSASPVTERSGSILEGHHKAKAKVGLNPRRSNDSGLVVDTPVIVTDDCQREVVFEIRHYPAYHFTDSSSVCTEQAKSKMRRTRSNESLGKTESSTGSRTGTGTHTDTASPQTAFNSSCTRLSK